MQRKDDMTDRDNRALGAFFEAARKDEPAPTQALMARVLADAGDVAAGFPQKAATPEPQQLARPRSRIYDLFSAFGGVAGAGVMAASVMLGAIVGYVAPDDLVALSGLNADAATSEDLDADMLEFSTADFSFYESDILP